MAQNGGYVVEHQSGNAIRKRRNKETYKVTSFFAAMYIHFQKQLLYADN